MAAKSWSMTTPADDALNYTWPSIDRDIKLHNQVAGGFFGEAQDTPDQTIAIYAGIAYFNRDKVEYVGSDDVDLGTGGAFEVSAMTDSYYNKILFTLNSSGTLVAYEGTEHAVLASVVEPDVPENEYPLVLVSVQDDGTATAGTIEVINQDDIQQIQGLAFVPVPSLYGESMAHFTYNDADEVDISGAVYMHDGTKKQFVYWDSELTYQFSSLAASTWSYLYLDDGDIVTNDSPVITTAQLSDSTTAPVWSDSKKGFYNGEDRCIGAVLTDSLADIKEFFQCGDLVLFADRVTIESGVSVDPSYTDLSAFRAPSFSNRILAMFKWDYSNTGAILFWRTNGQTGTLGHSLLKMQSGATVNTTQAQVVTDSNHIIEVKESIYNAGTLDVFQDGYFLPKGM